MKKGSPAISSMLSACMSSNTLPLMMQLRNSKRLWSERVATYGLLHLSPPSSTSSSNLSHLRGGDRQGIRGPYVSETLRQAERQYPLALLPAATGGDPDLAVSFHSASLPSFTQISSSSVNSSWATCSASSSVPRMNCTRWDGVSDEVGGCEGRKAR